jgi:DNA-binding beta-propeller fold protein YncE
MASTSIHSGLVALTLAAAASAAGPELLATSYDNDRIARLDPLTGDFLGVFAQGGPLDGPLGIAVAPDRTVWVTTLFSFSSVLDQVLQYEPDGTFIRVVVPGGVGGLERPNGLTFGPDGDFFVCNTGGGGNGGNILRFDMKSGALLQPFPFIPHGTFAPTGVNFPVEIVRHNGHYFVSEYHEATIRRFDAAGAPVGSTSFTPSLGFSASLQQFAFGPSGDIYAAVYFHDNISVFDGQTGELIDSAPVGFSGIGGPMGLAWGSDGDLYVSVHLEDRVVVLDGTTLNETRTLDPGNKAGLDRPAFIAFLPEAGVCYPDCNEDGSLTVADFGCFQTRFVTSDPYADCNGDTGFTVADFGCFQTKFVAGCP